MARKVGILHKLFHQRELKRWAQDVRNVDTADIDSLRASRDAARMLKVRLDALIHKADERLSMPQRAVSNFPRPHNSDWAWRPEQWRGPLGIAGLSSVQNKSTIGAGLSVFHDCPLAEITLRQFRNLRESDLAPFGIVLDVFDFKGSFLSLVVDLPPQAVEGLKRTHVIQMDALIEAEQPLDVFARLNIQHGPNTEQVTQEVILDSARARVEFDLAYTNLIENRVEKAWIDLIFESPAMNRIGLRDMTCSRRLRAAL